MNNAQKKLIGSVLAVSGIALLAYGGFEFYQAYDHNQSINNADESLGGLVSSFSDLIGSDVKSSYTLGLVLVGIGMADFIAGWLLLGKSN